MNDIIDMMASNESPADISDRIKEILMQKSAENIEIIRPVVAASIFGNEESDEETGEIEYEDDYKNSEEDAE
jgi:hypothetical protein